MNLLPYPRSLRRQAGFFVLPASGALHLPPELSRDTVLLPLAKRLQACAEAIGVELELTTGPAQHPHLVIAAKLSDSAPAQAEGYSLKIDKRGVWIDYRDVGGLRAGVATLLQLLREHGRKLPCVTIRDYPDFARRGVMLDVSRGRVPRLETLLDLVERLADFKINEFQLYIEHTFAYRNYKAVWGDWGALTGEEILLLDQRCRELGIDLVPNQNSFGHLRPWLEYPPLKKLAETDKPWPVANETFWRFPSTLAPNHPGTIPFLRELYDEFLPHFTSGYFNVGCDETWDLGRGQSRELCERAGKGRVYVDFLKQIQREVEQRGRQMMFWGDIILHHPELVKELPKNLIALNWGYEADHPFAKEAAIFAESGVPYYVCPGTSTWMTLIGKHDNSLANLRSAADVGRRHGARGYLITDWGDWGHPQPLAVSWPMYVAGAALAWNGQTFSETQLGPVLNRDIYHDPSGCTAKAALGLGFAHRQFGYVQPNVTPFGAVLPAPLPAMHELWCRDGLKYYARIPEKNVSAALEEVEAQRAVLYKSKPATHNGEMLTVELDTAARMAAESCHYMLWQQAVAAGKIGAAKTLARKATKRLHEIEHDYEAYWPWRNKGTTLKSSPFFAWRMQDYQQGRLHFTPEQARV